MKWTALDGSTPTDHNTNLTSDGGSNTGTTERSHHLRSSAVRDSQVRRYTHNMTETAKSSSSRRAASKQDDLTLGVNEPAMDQAASRHRKRGWPKGVPRKTQVFYFQSCNSIHLLVHYNYEQNTEDAPHSRCAVLFFFLLRYISSVVSTAAVDCAIARVKHDSYKWS